MSWTEKAAITQAVIDMLQVNMGLRSGEKLAIATDVPRPGDWPFLSLPKLQSMLERNVLARVVADIAAEHFPSCPVVFLPFPSTGASGAELDAASAARMREVDVLIALTTHSLSHTDARAAATSAGVRVASMPGFEAVMFEPGGPMAVDYRQVAAGCRAFADLLTQAREVLIRTPYGTELRFSIEGRPGHVDTGLYATDPQVWGNLPAGEAYVVPLEGTAEGTLVVAAGWYPHLEEEIVLRFERGEVVEVQAGGSVGDEFRRLLKPGDEDPTYTARRNLAELGIGTNPNARRPDNVLEAEKIKGTVHLGIGDNLHMGGQVAADLHEDLVQPEPDLILDGKPVIERGEWKIAMSHTNPSNG